MSRFPLHRPREVCCAIGDECTVAEANLGTSGSDLGQIPVWALGGVLCATTGDAYRNGQRNNGNHQKESVGPSAGSLRIRNPEAGRQYSAEGDPEGALNNC